MTSRKSIFTTGAASGIRIATAQRYAKEGWLRRRPLAAQETGTAPDS